MRPEFLRTLLYAALTFGVIWLFPFLSVSLGQEISLAIAGLIGLLFLYSLIQISHHLSPPEEVNYHPILTLLNKILDYIRYLPFHIRKYNRIRVQKSVFGGSVSWFGIGISLVFLLLPFVFSEKFERDLGKSLDYIYKYDPSIPATIGVVILFFSVCKIVRWDALEVKPIRAKKKSEHILIVGQMLAWIVAIMITCAAFSGYASLVFKSDPSYSEISDAGYAHCTALDKYFYIYSRGRKRIDVYKVYVKEHLVENLKCYSTEGEINKAIIDLSAALKKHEKNAEKNAEEAKKLIESMQISECNIIIMTGKFPRPSYYSSGDSRRWSAERYVYSLDWNKDWRVVAKPLEDACISGKVKFSSGGFDEQMPEVQNYILDVIEQYKAAHPPSQQPK